MAAYNTADSPEDCLEVIREEETPVLREQRPEVPNAQLIQEVAVLEDRKKSSANEASRKKSSVSKGESAVGGKRRKSSLFLRLKNFKSLPNISLPKIFKLSKLLKKEKSQPSMLTAGGDVAAAASTSSFAANGASSSPPLLVTATDIEGTASPIGLSTRSLGDGRFEAAIVAFATTGGWKRRRKGRIRTVLMHTEVRASSLAPTLPPPPPL
jgi:hypothetical protein